MHCTGRSSGKSYVAAVIAKLVYAYLFELSDPVKFDPATPAATYGRTAKRPESLLLDVDDLAGTVTPSRRRRSMCGAG